MGAPRHAVDVLVVADLLLFPGAVLPVLDDGQGDVGLEGQELPPHIGEGDDTVADQKVLVTDVEVILLKFAHFKGQIPVAAVEGAQNEYGSLLGLEIGCVHGEISLLDNGIYAVSEAVSFCLSSTVL